MCVGYGEGVGTEVSDPALISIKICELLPVPMSISIRQIITVSIVDNFYGYPLSMDTIVILFSLEESKNLFLSSAAESLTHIRGSVGYFLPKYI